MKSTVGAKGQVTIPKPLRLSLGLVPGAILDFDEREGWLFARRVLPADPPANLVGFLPPMDVDRFLRDARGPAWNPDSDPE